MRWMLADDLALGLADHTSLAHGTGLKKLMTSKECRSTRQQSVMCLLDLRIANHNDQGLYSNRKSIASKRWRAGMRRGAWMRGRPPRPWTRPSPSASRPMPALRWRIVPYRFSAGAGPSRPGWCVRETRPSGMHLTRSLMSMQGNRRREPSEPEAGCCLTWAPAAAATWRNALWLRAMQTAHAGHSRGLQHVQALR